MRVCARADDNAGLFCGHHRRHAPRRFGALFCDHLVAVVVHGVLHGPAHAQRLHALERSGGAVVEMGDGPAQIGDGEFFIDALEDGQELVHVFVAIPMHRQGQIVFGGPAHDFVILRYVGFGCLPGNTIHSPGDAFADAVEAQHLVAKSHRHHGQIIFVLLEFVGRRHAAEAVNHAQRQLSVVPDLEERLVRFRPDVISSGIHHPGQTQAIQFTEKFLRALDLLVEGRLGQAVE